MKTYLSFIVVAVAVITTANAVSHRGHFRSIKAAREIIENYEVVMPIISMKDRQLPFPKILEVTVPTQSKNYSLVLHMNQNVMSGGFTSIYFNQQGRMVKEKSPYLNCYYHGTVKGYPDWTVLMTTCRGLQGEFGVRGSNEDYYHLEPLDKKDPSMEQLHAFYKDSEYKIPLGSCGSKEHHTKEDHVIPEANDFQNNTYNARVRRQSSVRFVEWVVVNDDAQYVTYGRNLSATVQRAITIANGMDPLFQALTPSIRITLTGSITFTAGNKFTLASDSSTLLNQFREYVQDFQTDQHRDSIMLLTGIELDGDTVGVAFVNTMCNLRSSVGLTQDGGRALSSVVVTAAHELGHIFNMAHDEVHRDNSEICTCPESKCIMAAVSSSTPSTSFSSCSQSDFGELIAKNGDFCLFNTPTTPVEGERCGNGIREATEACDCGDVEECTDPCCNARTCQLAIGAQCPVGQCCDSQCRFKISGTQCRAKSGECDIADRCTGTSGECPEDIYVVDGTPCASDTGYCVGRNCPTHRAQCRQAWNSVEGGRRCYNLNTRGDQFGNCGHSSSTYLSCQSSDVRCGQLQCSDGVYQKIYKVGGTTLSIGIGSELCRSFTVSPSSEEPNPGLVAFGTKCGDGRLCMAERQCVSVSNLNAPTCPVGSNGLTCSGNSRGICNNLGQCSCHNGFSGSTCEAPPVNECMANNGGCAHICADTTHSFQCSCRSGYVLGNNGLSCTDVNECSSGTDNCGQICTNSAGSFTCSCRIGYTIDSNQQCTDNNECSSNNGGCQQICINTAGSFRCECPSGFALQADRVTCLDVDECATNMDNCPQICRNNQGGFTCDCFLGYLLNSDQNTCTDIDECATRNGGCQQECTNTRGSFVCSCNAGFVSSLNHCADVNECLSSNGGCNQNCKNTEGSFLCSCRIGYQLSSSTTNCVDIDECRSPNNGGCEMACINSDASFFCNCNFGYILDADGKGCSNINECSANNGGCVQNCFDDDGSFHCGCHAGFNLNNNRLTCSAINPCTSAEDNCEQFCSKFGTSVTCSCRNGYTLGSNRRSCVDTNECETNNGGCSQICSNSLGSFACNCNPGYSLAGDGYACNDVNECLFDNGGCDHVCTDTPESVTCSCREGFTFGSDGSTCIDVDECSQPNGQSCQEICINEVGSFKCDCNLGYTVDSDGKTCIDVDECTMDNGGCTHTCKNYEGSFRCSCNDGYVLDVNGFSCNDINECLRGDYGGCEQVCVNIPLGSNMCSCRQGFNLQQDGVSCTSANPCQDSSRCNQFCLKVGTHDICSCRTGYILATDGRTCIDVDECADAKNNHCNEKCVNLEGGYFCICSTPGTELTADGITCMNITSMRIENMETNNNVGAIAGGVIGGILILLIVALVVALVVFLAWRSHSKKEITSTSHTNTPTSYKITSTQKTASAEDLLNDQNNRKTKTTDFDHSHDSDNSFDDVTPAVYDNVTYDSETDTHIPLKKMPPPYPFLGKKALPPTGAPPQWMAPVHGTPPIKPTGKLSAPVPNKPSLASNTSIPPSSRPTPPTVKPTPPAVKPTPPSTKLPPSVPALKPMKPKPTPVPPARFSEQANNFKLLPPSKPTKPTEKQTPPVALQTAPKPASKPTPPKPFSKSTVPKPSSKPVVPETKKQSMAPPRW